MKSQRVLIAVVGLAVVAASALVWILNKGNGLNSLNSLWGIIGGVIALVLAIAPWLRRRTTSVSPQSNLLENLADAVRVQWRDEAEIQGFYRPSAPIIVTWRLYENGSWNGESGDVAGLARVFLASRSKRLTITGQAGSGKSVLVLTIILEILQQRTGQDPVPVLLPLSSWDPRQQGIQEWMAAQLEQTYVWLRDPSPAPDTSLALWLVKTRRILPVLDGLDELPQSTLPRALEILGRTFTSGVEDAADPVIVTVRIPNVDDSQLSNSALVAQLLPLSPDAIEKGLTSSKINNTAKWKPILNAIRNGPRSPIAQALSTPLAVALAREAYSTNSREPAELLSAGYVTRASIEERLFDQFLPSIYQHDSYEPDAGWTLEKARAWFTYLARDMTRRHTRQISWWELAPGFSIHVHWLLFGMTTGLAAAVAFYFIGGIAAGVMVGIGVAVLAQGVGRVAGVSTPAVVSVSIRTGTERFAAGFAGALTVGIILEFSLGLAPLDAIRAGGAVGLAGGLAAGLALLLEQPLDLHGPASPRSALRNDRTAMLIHAFAIGPLGGLAVGLAIGLYSDSGISGLTRAAIVLGLGLGLGGAIVIAQRAGFWTGLLAGGGLGIATGLIVYYALAQVPAPQTTLAVTIGTCLWIEIVLALTFTSAWARFRLAHMYACLRRRLPWRIIRFLEDAHRRGILRQVGPIYEFRHAALHDHLDSDLLH